jgi:hypothetical protein
MVIVSTSRPEAGLWSGELNVRFMRVPTFVLWVVDGNDHLV